MAIARRLPLPLFALLVVALGRGDASAGQVHVVDASNGPGTEFTSVQAAVDVAADGDVVLVRVGIYGGVTITGKGLSIVSDTGSELLRPILGPVRVENVPPSSRVVLRGFQSTIVPSPFGASSNLVLSANAGHVLVENVVFEGGSPGVAVTGTAQVLLVRCAVTGGGGPAVNAIGGGLHAHECVLTGGKGAAGAVTPFGTIPAGDGAPALRADQVTVVLSGSTLTGGAGGTGDGQCGAPGDGGPGLRLLGASPSAFVVGGVLHGGAGGGASASCPPASGAAGPPVDAPAGSVTTSPEAHRSLRVTSPAREGGSVGFDLKGLPGEPTVLLFSFQEDVQSFPALSGTLVPGSPLFGFSFLSIPPGGSVSFAAALPPFLLPAGLEALDVFVQVAAPGALGQGVLGSASVLTLLDVSL